MVKPVRSTSQKPDPWTGLKPDQNDPFAIWFSQQQQKWQQQKNKLNPSHYLTLSLGLALLLWVIAGLVVVHPNEEAVVFHLGRFDKILPQGLHWQPAWINSVVVLNTKAPLPIVANQTVLTSDEMMLNVGVTVEYRIDQPEQYVMNHAQPQVLVDSLVQRTLLESVAKFPLLQLLEQRDLLREQLSQSLTKKIQSLPLGVRVTRVILQQLDVPQEVAYQFALAKRALLDNQTRLKLAAAEVEPVIARAKLLAKQIQDQADISQQRLQIQADTVAQGFKALNVDRAKNADLLQKILLTVHMQQIYLPDLLVGMKADADKSPLENKRKDADLISKSAQESDRSWSPDDARTPWDPKQPSGWGAANDKRGAGFTKSPRTPLPVQGDQSLSSSQQKPVNTQSTVSEQFVPSNAGEQHAAN